MILHGTRVLRDIGRTRRTSLSPTISAGFALSKIVNLGTPRVWRAYRLSSRRGVTTPQTPPSFPGTLQSQNLDFKQGRVQQFNINVEHQLPGSIVVTAGYAGSRSSHILVDGMNLNVGSPAACGVVTGYYAWLRSWRDRF